MDIHKDSTIYKAHCYLYDKGTERDLSIIFRGQSEDDAIKQAALFLRGRCHHLAMSASVLTVSYLTISRIHEDGSYQTNEGIPFFEWKYDVSHYILKDLIESRDARRQTR